MTEFLNEIRGLWLIPFLFWMWMNWESYVDAEDAADRAEAAWFSLFTAGMLLAIRYLP